MIAKDCIDYEINFLNSDANVLKAIDWCEKHLSKYAYLIDENKKYNRLDKFKLIIRN